MVSLLLTACFCWRLYAKTLKFKFLGRYARDPACFLAERGSRGDLVVCKHGWFKRTHTYLIGNQFFKRERLTKCHKDWLLRTYGSRIFQNPSNFCLNSRISSRLNIEIFLSLPPEIASLHAHVNIQWRKSPDVTFIIHTACDWLIVSEFRNMIG